MPKIPRDLSGDKLAKLLKNTATRSLGAQESHIRLVSNLKKTIQKIAISAHNPIKIGTLNN